MEKLHGRAFFNQANSVASRIEPRAIDLLINSDLNGTWHPNGFAVYRLGDLRDIDFRRQLGLSETENLSMLANLRIHVWPKGFRQVFDRHPRIHCHSWWLYSHILAGQYEDKIFHKANTPTAKSTEVFEHDVEYINVECARIAPNGKTIHIEPTKDRSKFPGQYHFMAPNLYHETTIDEKAFCATLLFMSANKPGRDTLVHREKHEPFIVDRAYVNDLEHRTILQQLQLSRLAQRLSRVS